MRRLYVILLLMCVALSGVAQKIDQSKFEGRVNFIMGNDLGRNGYYDQRQIAESMGDYADAMYPVCIVAAGDTHHYEGIQSVHDPLWTSNFETIYTRPGLLYLWHPVLGNHEYRGNTQAMIDYSDVSRRWDMPARYYTKVFKYNGASVRIVWIDTTPLIDKYHKSSSYPDIKNQSADEQLKWIDSVLTASKEDWTVVVGHHPVYAQTEKAVSERTDMQKRLDPILRKHKVDVYACGHLHNFQHLRVKGTDTDYVVNSSGSLSRNVKPIDETQFCSSESGFSVFSVGKKDLNIYMIDKTGKIIYTVTRKR